MAAAEMYAICMCLWNAGMFSKLHTLDLGNVFSTSQRGGRQIQGVLTDLIQGTCGNLKRLYLAEAYVCEEAALAIADNCTQLEELSLPGWAGVTMRGEKRIALACRRLQSLRIGGGLVRSLPSHELALSREHVLPDGVVCREL